MPQVDRVFDSRHILKIEQIEAAAQVVGKQLIIVVDWRSVFWIEK